MLKYELKRGKTRIRLVFLLTFNSFNHQIFLQITSKSKQTKSQHCHIPFAILFVMFPLTDTFQTYSRSYSMETENGWQACIYYMLFTFYLLLITYYINNIFPTIKMDVNEYHIVSAYTVLCDFHVSLEIYAYLVYKNELNAEIMAKNHKKTISYHVIKKFYQYWPQFINKASWKLSFHLHFDTLSGIFPGIAALQT